MSTPEHEHKFVWSGEALLPCACGANVMAIESVLNAAAADARWVAGDAYYTGCRLRQESETLELWLCDAPSQLLQKLEAIRPGIFVIHNDAPHTLGELHALIHSIDLPGLKSQGIEVTRIGPTIDGKISVGVNTDIAAVKALFEAEYGDGLCRVFSAEPIRYGAWHGNVEPVL